APSGLARVNAHAPAGAAMATLSRAPVVMVGRAGGAQVRAERLELKPGARPAFDLVSELRARPGRARVHLQLHGEHHVDNALAVAAVALSLGLPVQDTAER